MGMSKFAGLALVELAVLVVALESLDRLLPSDGPALGRLSRPELRASDAACRKLPPPSSAEARPSDAAGRKLPPRRASRAESADLVLPKSSWVLRCLRPALTGVAPGLFAIVVASVRWITLPCTPAETPDAAAALSAPLRS